MFMLMRAAFWIAVVACFMPSNPGAHAVTSQARAMASAIVARDTVMAANTEIVPDALDARIHSADTYAAVAEVCSSSRDLCAAGVKAVDQAQDIAVEGLNALADAIDDDKKAPRARN